MAFHFPLDAVLHFRKSIEHQQELRLRAANQQVARVRHAIEQIEQRIKDGKTWRSGELAAGIIAVELQFSFLCESVLRQQIPELRHELARLQTLRDQQQRIYHHARREREILDSLRERQRREYERDALRREQRELDDLFLLRQAYMRQSSLKRDEEA